MGRHDRSFAPLGENVAKRVPATPGGVGQIEVAFAIDGYGILTVRGEDKCQVWWWGCRKVASQAAVSFSFSLSLSRRRSSVERSFKSVVLIRVELFESARQSLGWT